MTKLAGLGVALYFDEDYELEVIAPIGAELERRGALVRHTADFTEPADIGLYACHGNRFFDFQTGLWGSPPNRLSALAIHDLGQAGVMDAGYFQVEPWQAFDLGLLPGPALADTWERASAAGASGPRLGMRTIGWPKMDHVDAAPEAFAAHVRKLRNELGLSGRPVVLLACSWADRRQLADTLAALGDEDVDIVVKYPPPSRWPDDSPWRERLAAAEAERCAALELARADPRVAAADRREDIMALVALADVVLANGSNVLYEGILAGAPGVSISDWAHPAGLHGEQTVPPFIDLPGVLTGRAGDIADLVRLALDPRLAPVVARSAGTLVEPGTRGVAAGRAADVIEDALRSRA